jgi:PAS domain S-box-containing protein
MDRIETGKHVPALLDLDPVSWLAHSPEGAFIVGETGVEFVNQALADLLAYPLPLLRTSDFDWSALLHPGDRAAVISGMLARLRGSEPFDRIVLRVLRSDHSLLYLEASTGSLPGPRLWGIVRDVTASVSAEEVLRRHNRLLQGVNRATRCLIGHKVTAVQVGEALDSLVGATTADRVCLQIYERPPAEGPSAMVQRCAGIPDPGSALASLGDWWAQLARGQPVQAHVADLPEVQRGELEARSIESLLAVPLITDGALRGFLRFDQIAGPRLWDEADVSILQLMAGTFGSALAHREAETRLEASEARFRRLIENAADVIYRMSLPSGVYEYVSCAATEVLGCTPEELLARPQALRQLLHPGWRGYFEDQWALLLQGDMPPTYEYAILHSRTGETRWLYQRNTLIRDESGRPIAIEGVVSDVTDRRIAEIELRSREATLNGILRVAPVGIGTVADRVLLEVNDRVCTMTGYAREELLGQSARMLYASDEDFEYVERMKYAQTAQQGSGAMEIRWQRKDGTLIDIELNSTPLVPGNNAAGVIFTALDVTGRKEAEACMVESLHQREILLQEIHHRVKNNLALVSSLLSLQSLHLENPALGDPFNDCRERIQALARLYDHLYRTPDVDQVAMAPYVTQLVAELRVAYRSDVTIEVDAGELELHVDQATPCGLVLNELITNALRYAFPKKSAERDAPLVQVTLGRAGERVWLQVRDNGVGFAGEMGERDGSMGRSWLKLLARQLGGDLTITGQGGTCVTLRFPYPPPRVAQVAIQAGE